MLKLDCQKIVVTAGGTKEDIDGVRFIGNYSSGKMGIALADCAFASGANVVLVSTVGIERPYKVIKVNTALEMQNSLNTDYDCIIMAAAVSDFRMKDPIKQKIKKENNEELILKLVKNPDILSELAKNKLEHQIVVGFCAESENLIENAKAKIIKKGCDFLVANDISRDDIGFSSDYNEVCILNKKLQIKKIERDLKENIAKSILEEIYNGKF